MLFTGAAFLAASFGFLDLDPSTARPPRAILFLVSVIAIAGGLLIILRRETKWSNLLAGALLFAMAGIGGWAAVLGPAEKISGGLSFLPPETNVTLARIVFGTGAMLCLIVGAFALRRSIKT